MDLSSSPQGSMSEIMEDVIPENSGGFFNFLGLPTEIRLQIYKLVAMDVDSPTWYLKADRDRYNLRQYRTVWHWWYGECPWMNAAAALLRVCRLINLEATPFWYEQTELIIETEVDFFECHYPKVHRNIHNDYWHDHDDPMPEPKFVYLDNSTLQRIKRMRLSMELLWEDDCSYRRSRILNAALLHFLNRCENLETLDFELRGETGLDRQIIHGFEDLCVARGLEGCRILSEKWEEPYDLF